MMKNQNKKGFTIVELVIVIAVIAILAGVLIPTFVSLVNKANVANDTALIKNLNTALSTDVDGCNTIQEAIEAAASFGYDVAKINAAGTNNEILWDSVSKVFCYFNSEKGKVEYIPDSATGEKGEGAELWVISDEISEEYSTYYYGGTDISSATSTGIYVVTNGGTLTIDAPNADVYHDGVADLVEVKAVASSSYHLYGEVTTLKLTKGHVVFEANSKTQVLAILSDDASVAAPDSTAKLETVIFADAVSDSKLGDIKDTVSDAAQTIKEEKVAADDIDNAVAELTMFAGGAGTAESPYIISTREHMENLKANSDKYAYYKVANADVKIDFSLWTPGVMHGSFDGNGATFNLSTKLFTSVQVGETEGYVKNLNINASITDTGATAIFGSLKGGDAYTGNIVFENVNISGSITGAGAASYGSYGYANSVTFKNCTSSAVVTTTSTGVGSAGFMIHTLEIKSVYLVNSTFVGSLYYTTGERAGYWADMSVNSAWYVDAASSPANGLYTVNKTHNNNDVVEETSETVDGVAFTKYAVKDEYKTKTGYTCWYTYVKAVKSYQGVAINTITSTEMFSGNKLSINKSSEATHCTVTLFVSPHDKNNEGGYLGAYYTEDAIAVDGKWSSEEIVNFTVKINGNATTETGISADGKTFNIVNDFYGNQYGTAYVQFVEYNNDRIISITNITISNVNE